MELLAHPQILRLLESKADPKRAAEGDNKYHGKSHIYEWVIFRKMINNNI